MRVLGIETATVRGSVAIVESGAVIATAEHRVPMEHMERILPLVSRVLAAAGWARTSIDRVAVGTGPGSFTGVRIGIALAAGISRGLEVPWVGVGSLESMASAVPTSEAEIRWAVLDARRSELFVAAYDADGAEHVAPMLMPASAFGARARSGIVVGEAAATLDLPARLWRSDMTDLPHAAWSARLAEGRAPNSTVEPSYVREADAIRPKLPPSPFGDAE